MEGASGTFSDSGLETTALRRAAMLQRDGAVPSPEVLFEQHEAEAAAEAASLEAEAAVEIQTALAAVDGMSSDGRDQELSLVDTIRHFHARTVERHRLHRTTARREKALRQQKPTTEQPPKGARDPNFALQPFARGMQRVARFTLESSVEVTS